MDNTTTINLQVNGQQAAETLANLKQAALRLSNEIAAAAANGDKLTLKKLRKELTQTNRQIREMESATMQVDSVLRRLDQASPRDLQRTLTTLTKQLDYLQRGSSAWDEQVRKIKAVKDELARVNEEMSRSKTWLERFNDKFNEWQTIGAGAIAAFTGAVYAGKQAVTMYADMEQEMANVRKFTGMTADEVEHLNEAFRKMDTRTSREDLNKLAQEAGRLGKTSEEDVLGFVRAADKINVALDELGDGATLQLSKLTNIFGDEQVLGTERSMLAVGSVINELSQNCTASAGYLASFAQRLAGVGAQAKMTIPEIMAFGAVLDSQGQKVEMSATALSKLIMSLFKNTSKIATATGLDLDEFNAALSRSTNEGLLLLLNQLHQLGNMDVLAPVFSDMGENGARASAVLAALAGNIDMLRWEQDEAHKAYEEGTSVINEYNVQNNTVQAGLEKARKGFAEMAIALGQELQPALRHIISSTSATMRVLLLLVRYLKEHASTIISLTAAVVAYTLAVKASTIAQRAHTAAVTLATKGQAALQAVTILLRAAYYALTGQINRARAALTAFNMLAKTNPFALLTAAITAAVTALALYIRKQNELSATDKVIADTQKAITERYAEQKSRIDSLSDAVHNNRLALDKRTKALHELQSIIPSYHAQLTREGQLINDNTAAIDEYLNALNQQIALEAYQDKLREQYRTRAELEMTLADQQSKKQDAQRKYQQTLQVNPTQYDAAGNRQITFGTFRTNFALDALNAAQSDIDKTNRKLAETDDIIRSINDQIARYSTKTPDNTFTRTDSQELGRPETPDDTTTATSKNKFQAEDDWREREQALNRIAYARGEADYDAYTKRMLAIDVEYNQRKLAHTDLVGNEQVTIEADYEEALHKQRTNAIEGTIEQENDAYQEQLANLQQSYMDGKLTARQYQLATEQLELEHLRILANLQEEGSKERLKAEKQYLDTSRRQQQRHLEEDRKQQEKFRTEYFSKAYRIADNDSYQRDLQNLTLVYQQMLSATQANTKDRLRIEQAFYEAKYRLARKYNIKEAKDTKTQFRNAIDDLADWFQSDAGKAFEGTLSTLISGMSAIFSGVSDLVQAELDIETAAIETAYEKQISAAEGNKSKEVALENEKNAKIAKAKQEANRKQFAMEVMQAIAQTAMSAISAYSSAAAIPMVGYILAPAAAAMAVAAGAVQIAAIKKQQEASEATGYKEGGFTRKGKPDEVAGVVHAGEWVASQALLANPEARAIINTLDYAQRNNTIASLRADDVSRSITAPIRIADSIQRETTNAQPSTRSPQRATTNVSGASNANQLTPLLTKLNQRLSEPFVTINTVTGDAGIQKAQSDYQRLIRNKTPKSRR